MTAEIQALEPGEWEARASAHAERADALTAGRRERAGRGQRHPVEDFIYDYYALKPRVARRWHPGIGHGLIDADDHASWTWYSTSGGVTSVDVDGFWAARGGMARFVRELLTRTADRPAQLGCFGLHEWAMVYRAEDAERRHGLPLRLGPTGTDAVVEAHPIACTHFDAFRFFTAAAVPLNRTNLTRDGQPDMEQPGCLHANMDLFKWALKLAPIVPGDVLLDALELAIEIRCVDMRASPYDVSGLGLTPIAIETAQGKSEYASLQREFGERGNVLRERLVGVCDQASAYAIAVEAAG